MSDCLHCDINELVETHIEKSETVDVIDLTARMAESLADLILLIVPEEEQARMLAHAIAHLGEVYIQKSRGEGDTTH